MMRSMFSGVSGLRVHQTKMDVIAHNIANVNTVGYKASRVTFNEVFSQTVSGASGANAQTGRAGKNPMQIGLGTNVASIDKLMTQGATQRTDNPLDLMIQGDGFFVVGDNSGQYFTRAGNFILDEQGFISMNGMKLMGWDTAIENGLEVIKKDKVAPIRIAGDKEIMPPSSTQNIEITGNINPIKDGSSVKRTLSFYDSVGTRFTMDVELKYDTTNSTSTKAIWNIASPANGQVKIFPNGDEKNPVSATVAGFPGSLEFDAAGNLVNVGGTAGKQGSFTIIADATAPAGTSVIKPPGVFGDADPSTPNTAGKISLDFSGLKSYDGENTTMKATYLNGNEPGTIDGLSVGPDGKITGSYTNGMTKLLGQIPLAQFKNPAGLEKIGNNMFRPTANSGDFDGVGQDGDLQGGVLEMSNVDLAAEFTEMITTQRGFQANSRVISSSDEMLQELVNLKR